MNITYKLGLMLTFFLSAKGYANELSDNIYTSIKHNKEVITLVNELENKMDSVCSAPEILVTLEGSKLEKFFGNERVGLARIYCRTVAVLVEEISNKAKNSARYTESLAQIDVNFSIKADHSIRVGSVEQNGEIKKHTFSDNKDAVERDNAEFQRIINNRKNKP